MPDDTPVPAPDPASDFMAFAQFFSQQLSMKAVFATAEAQQSQWGDAALAASKTAMVEMYAIPANATELALAVLAECAGLKARLPSAPDIVPDIVPGIAPAPAAA